MTLITTEEALDQLRQGPEPADLADIVRKAEEASDIVLNYVTHEDKDLWTDFSAPGTIKAAVKMVLQSLYDEGAAGDPLSPAVKNLLRRYRQPTLA